MKTNKLILYTLLWLGIGAPASAQPSPADPEPPPAPVREITFSVFPLDQADWEEILYAPDGDPASGVEPLEFNPLERSIPYTYKGPLPLQFYRAGTDAEGEPIHRVVGVVNDLPEAVDVEGGSLILFFEQDRERGNGQCIVHHMLDNEERFPDESIVFFNTMDISFICVLGEHRTPLPPGASPPLKVNEYFEEEVPIAMAIRHNEDLHLVVRNKIRFSPQRRTLMILRSPRNSRSLRIRTQRITEFTGELASREEEEPQTDTASDE